MARSPEEVLCDEVGKFYRDPLGYVMFAFPWDTESAISIVRLAAGVDGMLSDDDLARQAAYRARFPSCEHGPDLWACDFLDELGREIRRRGFDGRTPVEPIYFATVSGHEIGKSALVAWLTKFILDTRPHSVGSITAVTDEQLRTKTWAEVGKWHKMSLTAHWYDYSSSRGNMALVHKQHPKWRADARTARKERSESFQGQHSPTATSFFIFDEASGIEPKIFEVREGGLTSGEPMVFDFGNGTQSSGAFYEECVGRLKDRFISRSIDSRTVAITNKEKIARDAEDYGEDSDFFRVRWRGMFPERGFVQFISTVDVDEAMSRELTQDLQSALVIGVDVARFGDDRSVIWPRRGRDARSFEPVAVKGYDSEEIISKVAEMYNYFVGLGTRPTMIFVDEGNTGGAVVDFLRKMGYPVQGVMFGVPPADRVHYRFLVDELWGRIRAAVRHGLCLPARDSRWGAEIHADLTQREFGFTLGDQRVNLETKAKLKQRGLPSPDFADALAVTYAVEMPDVPVGLSPLFRARSDINDWNPIEQEW